MKVLVEDVKLFQHEKILITVRLSSGISITLDSKLYEDGDIKDFIGKEVDMLLEGFRSPIAEHKLMPNNISPFELESKFYKLDMIEELEQNLKKIGKDNTFEIIPKSNIQKSSLIMEGTFIRKYFPSSKWKNPKVKMYEKGTPAFETEDGIILLTPVHLNPKMPYEDFPKKFKMFLSLRLLDWVVEGRERKLLVRKPMHENTDKSFRIFVNNVEPLSPTVFAGYVEIFLGEFCLIYEPYPVIHLEALVKGATENLILDRNNKDWEHNWLIVRGCGILGCCAGLFWDLVHKGEDITISNILWSRGIGYGVEEKIEGEFTIKFEDYKQEVLKLKEFISVL